MPSRLTLGISFAANPRTWPIIDGTVTPEGIDLVVTVLHPSEIFWRQLTFAEFDVSEMSLSSLMMAVAHGDARFVGIPIFTSRRFFHTGIIVRRAAGIERPEDLQGKRVAVPEYQQTAALWARGILQHEWGVAPTDMEWFMERPPERSHGGATGFVPPPGITLHTIPADKDIGTMMVAGEVDAALHYITDRNLVDRSTVDLWNDPDMRPLFPDRLAEGARYFQKTGMFPINHGMAIKREIAERHPWVVVNLYKAFEAARALTERRRQELVADHVTTGLISADAQAALAQPLHQYGIKANRRILETCAAYSHEQGLTPRVMAIEEIFADSTQEL
jgi:4,5-dihydroxyphthalate decarboxylase